MNTRAAKKLTIFIDETDTLHGRPIYELVMEVCFRNRAAGATVFRGVSGYGSSRKFHSAKILELSTALPVKIEVIDSDELISRILPEISSIVTKGLIEVSDTVIIETRG